jgi:ABC-type Na+ efflux pump permease subunit
MRDLLIFGIILAASCLFSAFILKAINGSYAPDKRKNIRSE